MKEGRRKIVGEVGIEIVIAGTVIGIVIVRRSASILLIGTEIATGIVIEIEGTERGKEKDPVVTDRILLLVAAVEVEAILGVEVKVRPTGVMAKVGALIIDCGSNFN